MRKNIHESTSNGYKIICVDDEPGVLDSLTVFLKHDGYQITGVTDPMEAIEKASSTYGRFDEAVKKIDPRNE